MGSNFDITDSLSIIFWLNGWWDRSLELPARKSHMPQRKVWAIRSLGFIFHSLIDAWFSKLFAHFLKVSPFCWCCMAPIFIGVVLEMCFYFSLFLYVVFAYFYNWLTVRGAPCFCKGRILFLSNCLASCYLTSSFKISTNGNFVVHESQRGGHSYELLMQNYCLVPTCSKLKGDKQPYCEMEKKELFFKWLHFMILNQFTGASGIRTIVILRERPGAEKGWK